MKKLLLFFIAALTFSQTTKAQDEEQSTSSYKDAVGIRLGSTVPAIKNGITYKHFIGNNALEGILSFGDGVGICGLYEIHKPLSTENLQWLVGFGGYVAFNNSSSNVGAAGIIGRNWVRKAHPELNWLGAVGRSGIERVRSVREQH